MLAAFHIGAVLHRHRGTSGSIRSVSRHDGRSTFSALRYRHVIGGNARHIVGDFDPDDGRAAVAVPVRHNHGKFMGNGIGTGLLMFLRGMGQCVGIGQL